jgi:ABC-2 type transport system permease protein
MSSRKLFTITKQEFRMTAANRAFIIITILGPFLILAVSILPGLFAQSQGSLGEKSEVAVIGADDEFYRFLESALAETRIEPERGKSFEAEKQRVLSGNIKGVLVLPDDYLQTPTFQYYSESGTDWTVSEVLSGVIGQTVIAARLEQEGIPADRVFRLITQPELQVNKIEEEEGSGTQDFFSIFATLMTFVMLLYMTVLLYGQMIGRSVITEKTNKTVEIMLSSVRPLDLLFGKIFGKGLAGLLQYGIWVGMALILAYVFGPMINIPLPRELTFTNLLFLILFFVLAFFIYSSAFVMMGAGAEDEQHLGQLSWPLIIFLVLPLVTISAFVANPENTFSVILSYFPMTAPIVMLIRIIIVSPPIWEILLCIIILLGTIAGFIVLSSKIFRVGILMTGKRFSFKEILRWARY